eukprot:scaffold61394_cov43-Attheya_sp.AAC.2
MDVPGRILLLRRGATTGLLWAAGDADVLETAPERVPLWRRRDVCLERTMSRRVSPVQKSEGCAVSLVPPWRRRANRRGLFYGHIP